MTTLSTTSVRADEITTDHVLVIPPAQYSAPGSPQRTVPVERLGRDGALYLVIGEQTCLRKRAGTMVTVLASCPECHEPSDGLCARCEADLDAYHAEMAETRGHGAP